VFSGLLKTPGHFDSYTQSTDHQSAKHLPEIVRFKKRFSSFNELQLIFWKYQNQGLDLYPISNILSCKGCLIY